MKVGKLLSIAAMSVLLLSGTALAQDYPNEGEVSNEVMPVLGAGEYGTDHDNQNNAGTGVADGDMDAYIFNTNSNHPIEFDIFIPATAAPKYKSATLRMDVYDIDLPDEIDTVFVNGKAVGALTGADGKWGVNYFDIPLGTLINGKNRVKVMVDRKHSGYWATTIDWGIIKLSNEVTISRGWITPVRQKKGMFINVFATISGKPAVVKVFAGSTFLFNLKDADGDYTWSGSYKVPLTWTAGWKPNIYIRAYNATGGVLSQWPGFTVLN